MHQYISFIHRLFFFLVTNYLLYTVISDGIPVCCEVTVESYLGAYDGTEETEFTGIN